ncbi:PIG-L family deacetylase [Nocardioides marinquilinus]|uniref:PIG-L family deacetylase n=1 Tax=Nocardioides marinquilinus TaxID=1210400 RepID=A0ABP9P734_9ACTN
MQPLHLDRLTEITALGAHCDDVAIGAGGTLLTFCRAHPGLRVRVLVLSGGGSDREAEERSALAALCPGAELEVVVGDLPDGRLPAHWDAAKEALEAFRRGGEPDVVLTTARHDHHQDHRGLAQLTPTVWRDHLVLGYEVLKAEADLAQPLLSVSLDDDVLAEKVAVLHEHYASQRDRAWFDDEAFRGLARLRGVQCGHRYAEAFHPERLVLDA